MPRGFKLDIEETKKRREAGVYRDKRSFRSIDGHDLLFGRDKVIRRDQIYMAQDRNDWIFLEFGEWDHVRNEHNNFRRCDCVAGGRWIRPEVHRAKHVQVKWTKRETTEA